MEGKVLAGIANSGGGVVASIPQVAIEIFCEAQEFASSSQMAAADRRMSRANVSIRMGGAQAAIDSYQTEATPDVVIVEVGGPPAIILKQLDALAAVCLAGTRVIVVGHANDVLLYRELMRKGVSDYLIAPVEVLTLVKAVSDAFNAPDTTPVGRTVAVMGCKGGVGASTIAHNLAWTASKGLGIGTVLADFDIAFGTVGLNFNQDPPVSIADAIVAGDNLDAAIVEGLLTKCRGNDNMHIVTAPAVLDVLGDMPENTADRIIEILCSVAPVVILDLPHIWSAWSRRALIAADEVVLVATPDLANLRNAKSIVEILRPLRSNDSIPKLVLNKMGVPKHQDIASKEFIKPLEVDLIESISFDAEVFHTASAKGQMIAEVQLSSRINEKFSKIATSVTGREEAKKTRKKLFESIRTTLRRQKASK